MKLSSVQFNESAEINKLALALNGWFDKWCVMRRIDMNLSYRMKQSKQLRLVSSDSSPVFFWTLESVQDAMNWWKFLMDFSCWTTFAWDNSWKVEVVAVPYEWGMRICTNSIDLPNWSSWNWKNSREHRKKQLKYSSTTEYKLSISGIVHCIP